MDSDPFVAWALPLILSMIPTCRHPRLFLQLANRLFQKGSFVDSLFLAKVPKDYRRAFRDHITNIRSADWKPYYFSLFLERLSEEPQTFLADRTLYNRVAGLIRRGAVAVVYGDLFAPETPDAVYAAMQTFPDPTLRTVYLSNLFDYNQREAGPLMRLLTGPWTDPEGSVLATSSPAGNLVPGFPPGTRGARDHYYYHTLSVSRAVGLLERYGYFGKPSPYGRGISILV